MELPKRRASVYTEQINIRVEPELREAFDEIKRTTSLDVPEIQRRVLRELVEKLKLAQESA